MSQPIAPFHVFIIKLRLFLQTLKRTTVYNAPDFYIYKEAECFAFRFTVSMLFLTALKDANITLADHPLLSFNYTRLMNTIDELYLISRVDVPAGVPPNLQQNH
jgi:hypothetical protein